MGRDNRHADFLKLARQFRHFVPAHAALQHVHRRNAEDDDEVIADGFAASFGNLKRKAHAVFVRAAPLVGALIGFFNQKRRQQIACRADNLDTVITGLFCQTRTFGMVGNLFFNACLVHLGRRESPDARFDGRGRNRRIIISQRPHMQNLHHEFAIGCRVMHRIGDNAMPCRLFII